MRLYDAFIDALAAEVRAHWAGVDRRCLEQRLQASVAVGATAYEEVEASPVAYVRHLGRHAPLRPDQLEGLALSDLYLACACRAGDTKAVSIFEALLRPEIGRAYREFAEESVPSRDEFEQELRTKLLVQHPERGARIDEYAGRGPLLKWIRVSVARAMIDRKRSIAARLGERPVSWQEDLAPQPGHDPELDYLKERYREPFSRAFELALGELDAKARRVLRLHFSEGLSGPRIARMHGVHRATASRWIHSAREVLLDRTRAHLKSEFRIDSTELDSLINIVRSRLDVSVRRHLVSGSG